MANLIEDILDLSKIQFDKFDPCLSWFSVPEIVKEVFDILEYQATEKEITLQLL
jgi:signal transduction histidine kinase